MTDSENERGNQGSNEAALVIRAQKRDKQAFDMLYLRYYSEISGYLSRMVGDNDVGCDITQETFLKVWLNLPRLRSPKLFTYWLYRIARNAAFDHKRRRSRLSQIPFNLDNESKLSVDGPEKGVEQRELIELALNQVSSLYRPCLILYVREELSHREVAQRLNMKEASVSTYLSRGREEFRQNYYRLLNEQGNVPPKRRKGKADE